MSSYIEGFEDGVRATKAEYLKLLEEDTHPAKTLTDEEIEDFTVRIYNCRTGAEAHEIVLAILRKAQDK